MAKAKSYTQAADELENILSFLENNTDASMDEVERKIKRASELITYCREKLREFDEKWLPKP